MILPFVPTLRQTKPVHGHPSYFYNAHFNIILSTPVFSKWFSFQVYPPEIRNFSWPPIRAMWPAHLIVLNFFSRWYCLVMSTNHDAHHHAVFSSPVLPPPFSPKLSSLTPIVTAPSANIVHLLWDTKFNTSRTSEKYVRSHSNFRLSTLELELTGAVHQ
jgi:hypothetical protein